MISPLPAIKYRLVSLCALCVLSFGPMTASPVIANSVFTSPEIRYKISWERPVRHYFSVEMKVLTRGADHIDVRIPAWRPGRYVLQDFSRNVVGFSASRPDGDDLDFVKLDKGTWRITSTGENEVIVRYRVYARELDAGNSYLDETEAYINPVSLLMYVPGRELEPVTLTLKDPLNWPVATALNRDDAGNFTADTYHELIDSPFIISPDFSTLSFEEGGATFQVVLQGKSNYDPDQITDALHRIVREQAASMGIIPFDRYVFLYHLLPTFMGHGVEHRNSTSIVVGPADFTNSRFYQGLFLGVTAHEFFHAWNVERIRPEAIYYPDYSRENYTTTMWVYEGVTSYYTMTTMLRTGLVSLDAFLGRLAGTIQGYDRSFGRRVTSVAMSSWDSWTKSSDAPPNTFFSFYTAGTVLGALLDLEVMGRTDAEKSLDDVFRYLYSNYAANTQGVPEDGFQRALEEVTGSSFEDFFDRYVYGTDDIDYDAYLGRAGFRLEKAVDLDRSPVQIGLETRQNGERTLVTAIVPGSFSDKAGFDLDDTLLSVDGENVAGNFDALLAQHLPGVDVVIEVRRGSRKLVLPVTLGSGGNIIYRFSGLTQVSDAQRRVRELWFSSRTGK
jgi:predicted metalloprotease with PDZ domain